MSLSASEQFQVLAKQLQFEKIPQGFKNAELQKLTVHENSKVWQFKLNLPALPAVQETADFVHRLTMSFQHLAEPDFKFNLSQQPDVATIAQYWNWVMQLHQNESGAFNPAFSHVVLEVTENQINLKFNSKAWLQYAEKTGMTIVSDTFYKLGLVDPLPFKLQVDDQLVQRSLNQNQQHRMQEQAEIAKKSTSQFGSATCSNASA